MTSPPYRRSGSSSPRPVEIFFSYAHEDKAALRRLLKFLRPLQQKGLIEPWHDGRIEPGSEWRCDIRDRLLSARILVPLVSADYLDSEECEKEWTAALERGILVLPVVLHYCLWQETPLVKLEVLPVGGDPIDTWNPRSKGYVNVANGIRSKVEKLLYDRPSGLSGPPEPPRPPGPSGPSGLSGPPSGRPTRPEKPRPFDNRPIPLNDFIGRKRELAHIVRRLRRKDQRILVLHGFAGIGKTRLALEAAARLRDRFSDGVCFVRFAQVKNTKLPMAAIARTLGVKESETGPVAEVGSQEPVRKILREYLARKEMLLVLDGFEHQASAGAGIEELLNGCAGLKVLLTCRAAPKAGDRDRSYQVPTLRLEDAVELFARNAKARAGFALTAGNRPLVARICSHLDCIPLSIELAAAQARLPLETILDEIDHRLLSSRAGDETGIPDWSKEISATIKWIYDRLDRSARELFHCLSAFSGGFTLAAATEVCGRDRMEHGLKALLESNIVRRVENGRFQIFGVLAAYGRKRQGKTGRLACRRHAELYLSLAERAEPELTSPRRWEWLELLEADQANLLGALHWCERHRDMDELARELGLRLAGALSWYWNLRAQFSEGRNRLEAALDGTSGRTSARAKALYGLGMLAFLQGDFNTAMEKLKESSAIWEALSDRRRLGYAQIVLGMAAASLNLFAFARACEETSQDIFQELGDDWWLALALNDLGNVYRAQGDYELAVGFYRKSLRLWKRIGDGWGLPLTLSNLGFLGMQKGHYEESRDAFQRALRIQEEEGDRWGRAETVKYLADLAVRERDPDRAARLYRESLALNREIGRNPFIIGCLAGIAVLAWKHGASEQAARLVGFVDAHRGTPRVYAKPIDHSMYEEIALAVHDLGNAREEGGKWSLEEVTSYALRISAPWEKDPNGSSRSKQARMSIPLQPQPPAAPREAQVRKEKGVEGRD